MLIYLVSAPGHENTGYGDGLIEGSHPMILVSFLEYANRDDRPIAGFNFSFKKTPNDEGLSSGAGLLPPEDLEQVRPGGRRARLDPV